MTKISPIAEYLTKNKAIVKKEGPISHFFSPEGLYLGKQVIIAQNGGNAYCREIYGEGLKKLYYECKFLVQHCVYYKNKKSPLGISIAPIISQLITRSVDYVNSTIGTKEEIKKMINKAELVAKDENTNTGIFDIKGKFRYENTLNKYENIPLNKEYIIKHTFH